MLSRFLTVAPGDGSDLNAKILILKE